MNISRCAKCNKPLMAMTDRTGETPAAKRVATAGRDACTSEERLGLPLS